jgi:hypothetical protein
VPSSFRRGEALPRPFETRCCGEEGDAMRRPYGVELRRIRDTPAGIPRSYFVAESLVNVAKASCTVVMNCAGKMMVEFFSTEISAMVCRVRS